MNCCARSARPDQQLTRYQSVCSCRSPPSARPVTRLTATLNSQTGRPFGVMRSSGSRPTLPMITILLTDATMSLVPSHYEVSQDVFGQANGALELACLGRRERELDDAFFFSGRGRHTIWPRDWSSDVCSSDLSDFTFSASAVRSARSATSTMNSSWT